ncbi:MAG TPA: carboxypeptidase regulatory-like domain-containing protein [Bryobacteraceae bacterium]|nr:carboxypeptidase regulatory-like domain-containing protein [Bryobacteraceae bacterium]
MWQLPLLLVCALAALAQEEPPPRLSGQVVAVSDAKPIKRAEVFLRGVQAGTGAFGALTDDRGRFAFYDIPDGSYQLYAVRDSFLASTYVLQGGGRVSLPLDLRQGKQAHDLTLKLAAAGVISGKVRHLDAEPASGFIVEAYRGHYERGRLLYDTAGRATTNDRGEYRLYNLPPGRYYLAAIDGSFRGTPAGFKQTEAKDSTGTRVSRERSVTTFFPSGWRLGEASTIELVYGAEIGNIDITLARARTSVLKGRAISGATGLQLKTVSVSLFRPDGTESGYVPARFTTTPEQDGSFKIEGIVPGNYLVDLAAVERQKQLRWKQGLVVTEAPDINLQAILLPEVKVQGFARLESKANVSLAGLQLQAEPRGDSPIARASLLQTGAFELALVPGEEYDLVLPKAREQLYLKSARLGPSDLLESGLRLFADTLTLMDIVLSPAGGQLGVGSEPGVVVQLVPADGRLEKFQGGITNEWGAIQFQGVAPGDYQVLAWVNQQPCEFFDPVRRQNCWQHGTSVSVRENGSASVSVVPSDLSTNAR